MAHKFADLLALPDAELIRNYDEVAKATGTVGILAGSMIKPAFAQDAMLWADTSRGRPCSKDPSVIYFNGRYLMYFSVPPKSGDDRWGQRLPPARTW